MSNIENERPGQVADIHDLLVSAFPTDGEAELVDDLRSAGALPVSLVASESASILGHIAFSPVSIRPVNLSTEVWALAPLAVTPTAQHRGIGSALVRAGLRACAAAGCHAVVVLGHPEFYSRFGFHPAAQRGLRCSFEAPPEAFMFAELGETTIPFHEGTVHFHAAFNRFAIPK